MQEPEHLGICSRRTQLRMYIIIESHHDP